MKIIRAFLITILFLLAISPIMASSQNISIDFFWAEGCPHCAKEKLFLDKLLIKYPTVKLNSYEISQNRNNALLLQQKGQELAADVSGVPFTIVGEKYIVGFSSDETTGAQIETFIKNELDNNNSNNPSPSPTSEFIPTPENQSIHLPIFGNINSNKFSLPVLTIMIAFLDGFNPCAMWTLLFLISLLLGMKNKKRMWALGITFIMASSLVYFLFLSAWLNLFIFLGFVSWIRIIIAVVALFAGITHLRGYFKNRSGCQVVANQKRQKVFSKLRAIATNQKFILAFGGIILLAFAVNLVELICSAGLPAIYTQVLSLSQLPTWQYYLYLLLYIFIFMLDDMFIFFTTMITLQMVGIQNKYTRASHLIGGVLMILISYLLLFKPELLMFN